MRPSAPSRRNLCVDPVVESASTPLLAKTVRRMAQSYELRGALDFLDGLANEAGGVLDLVSPSPYLSMAIYLIRSHMDGRLVTPTSLIAASGVPYATAARKMNDMRNAGLIEHRKRSRSGSSFSVHPSKSLIASVDALAARIHALANHHLSNPDGSSPLDVYFSGSYRYGAPIQPPKAIEKPITVPGGIRILVHGDPTFMVMEQLKRQFEQIIGTKVNQRAFPIDRLREEALRNAERKVSSYDIIAIDLPWVGEFVDKNVLLPLDSVMDVDRLRPEDFHPAGWKASHWGGRPYGVPSQTTPELLFYRKDLFADAGLNPPRTISEILHAASVLHRPSQGRYGIAWNAARGTALGHTFMMACADFGKPIVDLKPIPGGYDADCDPDTIRPTIDTQQGMAALEFLRELMAFSPPNILSMSWYERVRPYAAGTVAMAYGYTSLAPYFELDPASPAYGQTGYLPHPSGCGAPPMAVVGGYILGIPANLPAERRAEAVEALVAFTTAEAQKLYVLHGSRTSPRYSVGADSQVRQLSTVFETVDSLSWRGALQYWPRPPIPQISHLIQICGEEFHDMLRGIVSPQAALQRAQARADSLFSTKA